MQKPIRATWFCFFLALFLVLAIPAQALTVRVDSSGGVPRLLVNGQPVRARMLLAGPGSMAPLGLAPEARRIDQEFTPYFTTPAATLHVRFGAVPGEVFLDDLQITDMESGQEVLPRCDFAGGMEAFARDWTFWPQGTQNTGGTALPCLTTNVATVQVEPEVGCDGTEGLHVRLQAPAEGPWPDFHLYTHPRLALTRGHRYRVRFWARGEPERGLTLAFYEPGRRLRLLGGPCDCFTSQARYAAEAGVNLISFGMAMPWPRPGETADWPATDTLFESVLAVNPQALLLPRIWVTGPPNWWIQENPDDMIPQEDGSPGTMPAPISPRFLQDAAANLALLVEHLEAKFGDHVAGYHLAGYSAGEWNYTGLLGREPGAAQRPFSTAWRGWLKQRYREDAALRRAWGEATVTLDAAVIPSPAFRRASPAGALRDPVVERPVVDFAEFQQEIMTDCIAHLARVVRTATQGRKLVVSFYGYLFEFTGSGYGAPPANSGHYALRRMLRCPDVDVLCAPISYLDRGLGGSAPTMTAAESVALAGKMWLNEDDTATHLSTGNFPGGNYRAATLEETNAQLMRNVAQAALRHFGTGWMDLGGTGWFNDPGMWAEMKRLETLDGWFLENPTPFRPPVAAVIDDRSMLWVTQEGIAVTEPGILTSRRPLGRMGTPYGQYLLEDVQKGKVAAKMLVFLNAWQLSAEERQQLRRATSGKARVWCYAPGYLDGGQTSLKAMQELTGFRLEKVSPPRAWAEPTALGRARGLSRGWGVDGPVRPLFAATDARCGEVLATYPDGSAAAALRRGKDGLSVFVGVPGLTSELLRLVARAAGVHLFTQTDCNVYANGPFLVLHASASGPVAVNTGREGPVYDLFTQEMVAPRPKFSLEMKGGETRVLIVDHAAWLAGSAESEEPNLLVNPGFESPPPEGGTAPMAGWTTQLAGDVYVRPEAGEPYAYGPTGALDVHAGKDALYVAARRGGRAEVFQEVPVAANTRYGAAVWVKAYDADGQGFGTSPTDSAGFRVQELDANGQVVAEQGKVEIQQANNRYQRLSMTFTTGADTVRVRFILDTTLDCNHWHGCVKYDECLLQRIER